MKHFHALLCVDKSQKKKRAKSGSILSSVGRNLPALFLGIEKTS
ncbi:hypothetical protein [Enterococcus aquimarinus]